LHSDAIRHPLTGCRLTQGGLHSGVIKSWANRANQRFAEEGRGRFPGLDEVLAGRRLRLLDEADRLNDLTGGSAAILLRLQVAYGAPKPASP
jgi:hypothetical protein